MENIKKGYVYLIGDTEKDGIFKIGVTKGAIENRLKKLQTGNSGNLYILKYFQTEHPFFIESKLHFKYMPKKINGEWYELEKEDIDNFNNDCEKIENIIEVLKDNPFFPKKLK